MQGKTRMEETSVRLIDLGQCADFAAGAQYQTSYGVFSCIGPHCRFLEKIRFHRNLRKLEPMQETR
jgi:hypothetical protein